MKRVIVAGGRDFGNRQLEDGSPDRRWEHACRLLMGQAMYTLFTDWQDEKYPGFGLKPIKVLTGMARGADTMVIDWCVVNWVEWEEYPADWEQHGKSAGYLRNAKMADRADILVAFWDGKSRGTKHMIDIALEKGLTVHVFRYSSV